LEFNTTGHPGMASGGMGDVLTGLCAALAGQGLALHDAACVGSWLLGRAAELAVREGQIAPESVTAPLVAEYLGMAWRSLSIPGSP
jgi:NAD(P)H-hydrate epimerase